MTLAVRVIQAFHHHFGAPPESLAVAPGRVNLIGEHTDYNDGFVLPMAIDRAVCIALRPRSDRRVQLHSLDFDSTLAFDLDNFTTGAAGWPEYVKGVAWALLQAGHELAGWEGILAGDVPIGSGLSSSAATELATARAFASVSDLPWDAVAMAKLSQLAENQWVGVNCGIMDQLISAAGQADHALLIDCRSLAITPVPVPTPVRFLVLDSAAPRTLAGSAYNQRRAECEAAVLRLQPLDSTIKALRDVSPELLASEAGRLAPNELKRSRHIVTENARVLASVGALQMGDVQRLGALMAASHASLRDDYEVSSSQLDTLVDLALATPGVLGARLTGAGFGGCAIALVVPDAAGAAAETIIAQYRAATGLPGSAFVTTASQGAALLTL